MYLSVYTSNLLQPIKGSSQMTLLSFGELEAVSSGVWQTVYVSGRYC